MMGTTILYPAGMEEMAQEIAKSIGTEATVLCTSAALSSTTPENVGLDWGTFPSGDPNIKLRIDAVKDKHVVLLFSQDGSQGMFEQLSLLSFLQRFIEPHPLPEYAKGKWKKTVPDGAFDVCSAGQISVVIPWYRYCQMERTSRWTSAGGKWANSAPDGEWLDVPTAQTFASTLSAEPAEGSRGAPMRLLLIDIHEYEDLERCLNATSRWSNVPTPYDFVHGQGTFFASGFNSFLADVFLPTLTDVSKAFVVFPDFGAHRRFYTMVHTQVKGLPLEHVLWIDKSRVGEKVTQTDGFSYVDAAGKEVHRDAPFPDNAQVLIADDFTNSGSTLFGGANIIRKHAGSGISVSAYVSHFVAKYDRSTVASFAKKLYAEDGGAPSLDYFHCTNSIPLVTSWLGEEIAARTAKGLDSRAQVMSLAPTIAKWLKQSSSPSDPKSEEYYVTVKGLIESSISSAVNEAIQAKAADPISYICEMLKKQVIAQVQATGANSGS